MGIFLVTVLLDHFADTAIISNVFQQFGNTPIAFDFESDLLVHLHLPKTGGSVFGQQLLQLNVSSPCQPLGTAARLGLDIVARKQTLRSGQTRALSVAEWKSICPVGSQLQATCKSQHGRTWMYHRLAGGWGCGVHPSYDRFLPCIAKMFPHKRRIFVVTVLRHPSTRYPSEHRQTFTNAWPIAKNHPVESDFYCNGTKLSIETRWSIVSACRGIDLPSMIACENDVAENRLVRMLGSAGCHRPDDTQLRRRQRQYDNAIQNLRKIPFFGLHECYELSIAMFERFFGMKFSSRRFYEAFVSSPLSVNGAREHATKIGLVNHFDALLYAEALGIFNARLHALNIKGECTPLRPKAARL